MAIALGGQTNLAGGGAGNLTSTVNVAVTGSNNYLLAFVADQSGDSVTSVTCLKGGIPTAMTLLKKQNRGPANPSTYEIYVYGIYEPDTGTNTILATRTGTTAQIFVGGIQLTGALQQTTPVDAPQGQDGDAAGGTKSGSITTTENGSAILFFVLNDNGAVTASTNLTATSLATSAGSVFRSSTFPQTTAGAFTGTWTQNPSGDWASIQIAISPAGTPPAASGAGFFFNMVQ
jgi:hypothetical protein